MVAGAIIEGYNKKDVGWTLRASKRKILFYEK
jgi:hypothetical protein